MMIDVGRVCVKLAGRDAGKRCVVVDVLDDKYVLVDGETRRKKCNMNHLEPLAETMDIKKGAEREAVKEAFKAQGIELKDKKPKEKKDQKGKAES